MNSPARTQQFSLSPDYVTQVSKHYQPPFPHRGSIGGIGGTKSIALSPTHSSMSSFFSDSSSSAGDNFVVNAQVIFKVSIRNIKKIILLKMVAIRFGLKSDFSVLLDGTSYNDKWNISFNCR